MVGQTIGIKQSRSGYTNKELTSYIFAHLKVSVIQNRLDNILAGTSSVPLKEKSVRKGEQEMEMVINDAGLDIEVYNGITSEIETDDRLRTLILEGLQVAQLE